MTNSVEKAGAAAAAAEVRKRKKYSELNSNYIFTPLTFETLGLFGEAAAEFISEIGEIKAGNKRATEFLRQRYSLEIQRGNAISVLAATKEGPNLDNLLL